MRGSHDGDASAKHVVTAFASDLQLVLGQLATDEKSNEIKAIPKLLDMFCVSGNIITIDAIGIQTAIAVKIIEKGGDYALALKENQPTLLADIKFFVEQEIPTQKVSTLKEMGLYAKTLDKGYGRIETRECFLVPNLSWLDTRQGWAGLQGAAMIRSKCQMSNGNTSTSEQLFIHSCKDMTAERFLQI